ncbi:MAG: ATP-dependent DNA helicase [Betaproteobacteria bacterium]
MTLAQAVAAEFLPTAGLSRLIPGFRARPGQTEMALAVAQTLQDGGVLVVEAGTGVGKTLAYLVPALLSGEKVLFSTATKALQDQLFLRDIPLALAALGLPVRVALLKGRSSYLCAQRLSHARQETQALTALDLRLLARIEDWSLATRVGDMAEVAELDEQSIVLPLVTSTRENCLGAGCPQITNCHTAQARQHALGADLVVVNHHLFFADLGVRASGVAELLPSVRTVVFDEAHQLNDIGIHFFSQQWSTGQVLALAHDLAAQSLGLARGLVDWMGLHADLVHAAQALRTLWGGDALPGTRTWVGDIPADVEPARWQSGAGRCLQALHAAASALDAVCALDPLFVALAGRCDALDQALCGFLKPTPSGQVRWVEWGANLRLSQSPLTIAEPLRDLVQPGAVSDGSTKSWVFTSATLGTDAQLGWFVDTCGLEGARVLRVASPFDYPAQSAVYVPSDFPKPQDSQHSARVADLAAHGAGVLNGRTMVLTTTLRAMRAIADALRDNFAASGQRIKVLVQGQAPKRALLDQFAQAAVCTGASGLETRGCVLVATASFWEGIDLSGDALELLVIDKLPFAPPDDPLVQARAKAHVEAGENAFKRLHLPQAAIALKQGAGRLIRSEADRGILVVCDVRLAQMGYGKKLMEALPPMRRLRDEDQWHQALEALRKA